MLEVCSGRSSLKEDRDAVSDVGCVDAVWQVGDVVSDVGCVGAVWQVGDVVLVTAMNINGQWEGEVNGRRGDFPFVYIQFDDELADTDPDPSQ